MKVWSSFAFAAWSRAGEGKFQLFSVSVYRIVQQRYYAQTWHKDLISVYVFRELVISKLCVLASMFVLHV